MQEVKAKLLKAWPYQQDKMKLPVGNVESAIPFYETYLAFHVVSRADAPFKSAILQRDDLQVGLEENGCDPTQDGCFFEVDDVQKAFDECKTSGLTKELSDFSLQKHGDVNWKVFFVVAPDGLCYCFGQKQS